MDFMSLERTRTFWVLHWNRELKWIKRVFVILLMLTSFSLKYCRMFFWYSMTSKNLSRSLRGSELSKSIWDLSIDITDIGDTTPLTDIGVSVWHSFWTGISRRGSLKVIYFYLGKFLLKKCAFLPLSYDFIQFLFVGNYCLSIFINRECFELFNRNGIFDRGIFLGFFASSHCYLRLASFLSLTEWSLQRICNELYCKDNGLRSIAKLTDFLLFAGMFEFETFDNTPKLRGWVAFAPKIILFCCGSGFFFGTCWFSFSTSSWMWNRDVAIAVFIFNFSSQRKTRFQIGKKRLKLNFLHTNTITFNQTHKIQKRKGKNIWIFWQFLYDWIYISSFFSTFLVVTFVYLSKILTFLWSLKLL